MTKKKSLSIISLMLLLKLSVSAQIGIGGGLARYSVDTKNSSDYGLSIAISYNGFYLDFGGNMSTGKGEYLEFSSGETYTLDKISVTAFNFGYIIPVWKVFSVCPVIGLGMTSKIYQDPIGWDTYFTRKDKTYGNIGGALYAKLADNTSIKLGFGTFEKFNAGILWTFDLH